MTDPPIQNITFGELKGIRLDSPVLMDRWTGKSVPDTQHLKNCIIDILTTRLGSRVMLRDYGCDLFRLLDRPINKDLIVELYALIHGALQKWEPRILVTKLRVDATDWQNGRVGLELEAHSLLENGPLRISDLSINFMASNAFYVEDPEASARDYDTPRFGDLALESPDTYVLAATGDTGVANTEQEEKAAFMASLNPAFYLMAGDLNYVFGEASTIMANTAPYEGVINNQQYLPAIGNHDATLTGDISAHLDRYSYLPGNKRYYRVDMFGGLVTLLVINTGYDSPGNPTLEPDGNTAGSVQHAWVLNELENCQSPYVIVMGHHPFASQVSSGGDSNFPALAWIKDLPKVQLYLHGHTHTGQHNIYAPAGQLKLHTLDVSAGVQSSRNMSLSETMYGDASGMQNVWAYAPPGMSGPSVAAKLVVTTRFMLVEVYDVTSGQLLHTFTILPRT